MPAAVGRAGIDLPPFCRLPGLQGSGPGLPPAYALLDGEPCARDPYGVAKIQTSSGEARVGSPPAVGKGTGEPRAAAIAARLDRLPASRLMWSYVVLISLGGFFEFFDLFMTAYLSPGLIRSGMFHSGVHGFFGLS